MTEQEIIKKLEKDLKNIKKGKQRKFFWLEHYDVDPFMFLTEQNEYVMKRMKKDRMREFEKIADDKLADKYGFNARKQSEQQLNAWVKETSVVLPVEAYEVEYEINFLKMKMKTGV